MYKKYIYFMYIPILFYISYYKIKFLYIYIYTINSILLVEKKNKRKDHHKTLRLYHKPLNKYLIKIFVI